MLLYYQQASPFRAEFLIFQANVRIDGFIQGLTLTIQEIPRHLCRGFSFHEILAHFAYFGHEAESLKRRIHRTKTLVT